MKPKYHKKPQEKTPTNPSDFSFNIAQIAVSQICQSLGFKSAQLSALKTLTHVATLYLTTLAKTAASYSNASNRTQSNLFDLVNSLNDISSIDGFTGAATLSNDDACLLRSGVIKDVFFFVNSTREIPFAKPIPMRNSIPFQRDLDSMNLESRRGFHLHIPKWLPEFPDESTYKKRIGCDDVGDDKRRKGDLVLWEDSHLVQNCGGNGIGFQSIERENQKKKSGYGGDLLKNRGNLRFKIGRGRDL